MSGNVVFAKKLINCIRVGRNNEVKLLLSEELAKASDAWGTLLHHSVALNNVVVIQYLLQLGSDINAISSDYRSPLVIAVQRGHASIIKILLEAGADFDRACFNGKSALETALDARYTQRRVLQCLIPKVRSTSHSDNIFIDRLLRAGCTLHCAVVFGDVEVLNSMLNRPKANVNLTTFGGCTAVMVAAEQNDVESVRILIEKGADVKITDSNANNALFAAARFSNSSMMELLLERGVEAKQENVAGHTAFSTLLLLPPRINDKGQTVRCAELLLESGTPLTTSKFDLSAHFNYVAVPQKRALAHTLVAHQTLLRLSNDDIAMYAEYEQLCQQTLKINIFDGVSLHELLIEKCEHKMRIRARNENFSSKIQHFCSELKLAQVYPYYNSLLMKRVAEIVRTVELEDKAIVVVCKIFNSTFNRCFIVSRMVVEYLKKRDLEQLCRM